VIRGGVSVSLLSPWPWQSAAKQFGVSVKVWRLAGDALNITCILLCCNNQVHIDFLITLYMSILSVMEVNGKAVVSGLGTYIGVEPRLQAFYIT
jgi:hypothetical protein